MAEKSEIIDCIEALAVHCRPPLMSIDQRQLWLRDWCIDLAQFPAEAVAAGCRAWRHSEATKFPTVGQLLPMIRNALPSEHTGPVRVWEPATEEEYRSMSVREKIREHQILANEAYGKAGPMFRNTTGGAGMSRASGVHLHAEQMRPDHHRWVDEGRRHSAEAARLRQYLHAQPAKAQA